MGRHRGGERPARSKTMETTGLGGTTERVDRQTGVFSGLSDLTIARQLEQNIRVDDDWLQKEIILIRMELEGDYANKLKGVEEGHKNEVTQLQADKEFLRKTNHRLHDQFSEVDNQNEDLRAQIKELQTRLSGVDTLRGRIKELHTQLSGVDTLKDRIRELQTQLSQEDDVNKKWENELDSQVCDIKSTHAEDIAKLEKSSAEVIAKYKHANGVLQDKLLQSGSTVKKFEDLQAELAATQAELMAAQTTISKMNELQVSTLQQADAAVLGSRRSFVQHAKSVQKCPCAWPVTESLFILLPRLRYRNPDTDNVDGGGAIICMFVMNVLAVQDLNVPPFGGQCAHSFGRMNESGDSTQQNRVLVIEAFILLQQKALCLYGLIQRQHNENNSFNVKKIVPAIIEFKTAAMTFISAKGWPEADIQLPWDDLVHLLLTLVGYNQSFVNCVEGSQYPKVTPWSKAERDRLITELNPVVSCSGQQDPGVPNGRYTWRAELAGPDTIRVLVPGPSDGLDELQYSVRIETQARCWVMTFVTVRHYSRIYIIKVGHNGNGIYTLRHPTREEDVFLSADGKLVVDGIRNIGGCNENSGMKLKSVVYTIVPQDYIDPY